MIKFRNDVICNLDINWLTPLKKRKIYVTGENGMFTVDYINQDLIFHENSSKDKNGKDNKFLITEGRMIKYNIHKKEPLRLELEHFVNCVLNNTEPLVSGEDGLRALELANKIIESANKNEVIKDE
jgi:predicted dehydrogenase